MFVTGESHECRDQPSDCDLFGFTYIRSDKANCTTGQRVLCGAPWINPRRIPSPANELHVMTYNIYEFTYFDSPTGQVQRTCRIPGTIAEQFPEVDVIVFEEVFMGGCWPEKGVHFRDLLQFYGFVYSTKITGDQKTGGDNTGSKYLYMNGGVMIASRYPIIKESEYDYEALNPNANLQRAVSYAKIVKSVAGENKTYHVFGTHSESSNSSDFYQNIRKLQALEFRAFINSMQIPNSEPVILAADFNMDFITSRWEVVEVLEILQAVSPPVIGQETATWNPDNQFLPSTEVPQYVDYVLYDVTSQQPIHAQQYIVTPRAEAPFRICVKKVGFEYVWPDDRRCLEVTELTDLSDHFAVIGTLVF